MFSLFFLFLLLLLLQFLSVETPDWRGAEWCYVEDAKCTVSLKSDVEGLTLKWMRCDTTQTCKICPPNSNLVDPMGPVQNSCACNEDYYAEITGTTMTCIKCADDKAALPGSTECKCKQGTHYLLDPKNGTCSICPPEADCSFKSNTLITEIVPKPGYWRTNFHSSLFSDCSQGHRGLNATNIAKTRCCPHKNNESICKELNSTSFQADAQCLTGYVGALCLVCANDYVKMGGECIACPGGASFTTALIPLGIVSGTLFIFVLLYLCCNAKKKNNATPDSRKVNRFFGQLKILLSFFQIFSSMPSVLDSVPWPNVVLEFSIPFSVFNLDVLTLLSQTSCGVSVRFFSRFLLHMILPFFCLVAVGMAYILSRACKTRLEARTRLNEKASKVIILITLLLFPGLTTKIFQVGKCQSIVGIKDKLLVQDAAITCYVGEHFTFIFIAVGFFCLYVVGMPLTMFMLMWKNRKHLHDETSSRHAIVKKALGGLYSQCKCYVLSICIVSQPPIVSVSCSVSYTVSSVISLSPSPYLL